MLNINKLLLDKLCFYSWMIPKNTSDISPESLTHQKIHGDVVASGQRAGTMRAERQEGDLPQSSTDSRYIRLPVVSVRIDLCITVGSTLQYKATVVVIELKCLLLLHVTNKDLFRLLWIKPT